VRRSRRRQFLFLRAYTIVSSLALIVLGAAAFRQASAPNEITVERINVVDASGTLRMVISNKDRMHPGVMDGVTHRGISGLGPRGQPPERVDHAAQRGEQARGGSGARRGDRAALVALADANGKPRLTLD
jgi:hypothetical protein